MIILGVVLLMVLAGCSDRLTDEELIEYRRMERVYNDMQYKIDIEKYKDAILFLVSPDKVDKNYIEKGRELYGDIINESIFNKFIEELPDEISDEPLDNFDNYEDYNIEIDEESIKNEEYPIYGSHLEIIGYGTLEEHQKSLEEFNSLPDNIIKFISIYKGLLVIKLDNKYTGEFMVSVKLDQNGTIIDFDIYR